MGNPKLRTPARPLEPLRTWLVGKAQRIEELKGAPFLLHFWSIDCGLCHDQLPHVASWEASFIPRGLEMVSIHVPMTDEIPDDDLVLGMFEGHALRHPMAVDDTGYVATQFGVSVLPTYLLYDGEGLLRHFHAGAGAEVTVKAAMERLLQGDEHAAPAAP